MWKRRKKIYIKYSTIIYDKWKTKGKYGWTENKLKHFSMSTETIARVVPALSTVTTHFLTHCDEWNVLRTTGINIIIIIKRYNPQSLFTLMPGLPIDGLTEERCCYFYYNLLFIYLFVFFFSLDYFASTLLVHFFCYFGKGWSDETTKIIQTFKKSSGEKIKIVEFSVVLLFYFIYVDTQSTDGKLLSQVKMFWMLILG